MFNNCVNLVYVNFNLKHYFIVEQAHDMFLNCKSFDINRAYKIKYIISN